MAHSPYGWDDGDGTIKQGSLAIAMKATIYAAEAR